MKLLRKLLKLKEDKEDKTPLTDETVMHHFNKCLLCWKQCGTWIFTLHCKQEFGKDFFQRYQIFNRSVYPQCPLLKDYFNEKYSEKNEEWQHKSIFEMMKEGSHRLNITEKEDYVELVYIPPKKDKDESSQ